MTALLPRPSTPPNANGRDDNDDASVGPNDNSTTGNAIGNLDFGNATGVGGMMSPMIPLSPRQEEPSPTQQQQPPQTPTLEAPLTPLMLYSPPPRNETEARESFRRGAIDKAHEISALSWPEHIQNHDKHRFRNATKLRPRASQYYKSKSFRKPSSSGLLVLDVIPSAMEDEEGQQQQTQPQTQQQKQQRHQTQQPPPSLHPQLQPRLPDDRLLLLRSARSIHSLSARSTLRKRRRSSSHGDLDLATRSNSNAITSAATTETISRGIILGDESRTFREDDGDAMVAATSSISVPKPKSKIAEADGKGIKVVVVTSSRSVAFDESVARDLEPSNEAATATTPTGEASTKQPSSPKPAKRVSAPLVDLATWERTYNRHVQLLVSLALFSYIGQFARFFIEAVFGKACHEPGSFAEWLSYPPVAVCTSSPGTTDSTGGAFFTDLPVNVIGSFLMGLLVSGDGESISVNLPIAAFPRGHFFQNWVVTHVGLRTGFCGALTTFASWNTQMVIMVCGTPKASALGDSQWVSALWGYLIGFYASLQSYQFGVSLAFVLSRHWNPDLAEEADQIVDKKAIGVLIHRDLPDFERRFLHSIVLEERNQEGEVEKGQQQRNNASSNLSRYGRGCYEPYYQDHIHHLESWKATTDDHRHGRHRRRGSSVVQMTKNSYVKELHEIEKHLLVDRIEPRQELLEIARDAGWNVDSLKNWTSALVREEERANRAKAAASKAAGNFGPSKDPARSAGGRDEDEDDSYDFEAGSNIITNNDDHDDPSVADTDLEDAYFSSSASSSYSSMTEVGITGMCFVVVTALLLAGYFRYDRDEFHNNDDAASVVAAGWRAQFLSSLLAPLGTYCRWYLSRLNGSLRDERWEWLPIGTFLANMLASSVSALCSGILLVADLDGVGITLVKAVQSGFAGSCSTVSTFCTETTGLLRALPRAFWGYYYGFGSMACGLVIGVFSYVWAVAI